MNAWLTLPWAVVALSVPFGTGVVLQRLTRKRESLGALVVYPVLFISSLLPSVCMGFFAAHFGASRSQSIAISLFFLFLGCIMFGLGYPAFAKK
jgi:hypothetical protein